MTQQKVFYLRMVVIVNLFGISSCIELPHALIDTLTTNSFHITWADAPNPAYSIKQYAVTLQHPPGTPVNTVTVDAVAGASLTFDGLDAANEYGLRLDAVLHEDILVELDIFNIVWTLPHAPTDAVLQWTGDRTATLGWTKALGPVDFYLLTVSPAGSQGRVFELPSTVSYLILDNLDSRVQYGFKLVSAVNTPQNAHHQTVQSSYAGITFAEMDKPPQPRHFTVQYFGTSVIECKWEVTSGDFDHYLLVFYAHQVSDLLEVDSQVIEKNITTYRYPSENREITAIELFTQKGTTRSTAAQPRELPAVVINIKVPLLYIDRRTASSFEVTWQDAPDPADNIKQYEVTLHHPPGVPVYRVVVGAVAGASHTFEELNAAEKYGLGVDAILHGDIPVELNVLDTVWTLPNAPSDAVLRETGNATALLTWSSAQGPVDFYELTISQDGVADRIYQFPKTVNVHSLNAIHPGVQYGSRFVSVVFTPNDESDQLVIKSHSAKITLAVYEGCHDDNPCAHGVCRVEGMTTTCSCEGTDHWGEFCENHGVITTSRPVLISLASLIGILIWSWYNYFSLL